MVEKDLGLVLRRYDFRETSVITSLYTSRFGKIRGILKGFYTSKREFSSSLDLFSLNEIIFYPKKSEIWLVSYADLFLDYPFLRKNLVKAKTAAIFTQLIDKVMPLWDNNSYIFDLAINCLSALEEQREQKILCIFIIKLLTYSGFKPEFNHCIACRCLLDDKMFFSASRGGLLCQRCCKEAKDVQRISRQTSHSILYIQRENFPLVYRLNLSLKCEIEIIDILRSFLAYHFEFNDVFMNNARNSEFTLSYT
ncbi:MAG: DNA repair protein RecO [Candidatus Omnitrophica bacterium]|jgi:DNA repair protein RecO (recombination protein O)|nr:DNA repair protein RecO [Candidatus Omnitrophota bacterium]